MDAHLSAFVLQFLRVSLMALVPVVATAFYTTQTQFPDPMASVGARTAATDRHMT